MQREDDFSRHAPSAQAGESLPRHPVALVFEPEPEPEPQLPAPSAFRLLIFRLLALAFGLLLCLLGLELLLRLLPVNEGLFLEPVHDEQPLARYAPNQQVRWSRGWRFQLRNLVQTNNHGFVNDQDYDPQDSRPLLAIVGDSYVEAAMLPFVQSFGGRLARLVGERGRVYTLGVSGAPLSQSLAYAQFVRRTFGRPEALVVTVVSNDLDESLLAYKAYPGFHYFEETSTAVDGGGLRLVRRDLPPPSRTRRWLRASVLARYLLLDAQIQRPLRQWRRPGTGADRAPKVADGKRLAASRRAIAAALAELPERSGLPPEQIFLVVDAIRAQIYDPTLRAWAESSNFGILRWELLATAQEQGFGVLDLEPVFRRHYARHQMRFEYPSDGHWNALGHQLVAQAIADSGWLEPWGIPAADALGEGGE